MGEQRAEAFRESGSDAYTPGEVKRHVKALWDRVDEQRREVAVLRDRVESIGGDLTRLDAKQDSGFARIMDKLETIAAATPSRCVEHGMQIAVLKEESEDITERMDYLEKNPPCEKCQNKNRITGMESALKSYVTRDQLQNLAEKYEMLISVVRWFGITFGGGVALMALRGVWVHVFGGA